MVDIQDRGPVVLEPQDAWRWMDPDTPVEEAALIAQTSSLPADPNNNRKELLAPITEPTPNHENHHT